MLVEKISNIVKLSFIERGLDSSLGELRPSNRPELSDFQCNGALQAAKFLTKSPKNIAEELKIELVKHGIFKSVTVDGPGFLNFVLSDAFILGELLRTNETPKIERQKIVIDYGGPNVAKPLHVGHLRSSIIGESLKRTARALGHEVISDIHLGDWGTPMGMLIAELKIRHPDWVYFNEDFVAGPETAHPPFDVNVLNDLYPEAAKRFKEDSQFAELARKATADLQSGHKGYRALWGHFVSLSLGSIQQDFKALDVSFDLWLGESDADSLVAPMIEDLVERGIAIKNDGAIIVDVKKEGDKHDVPPLMLKKRDGAVTYAATDLATIFQRAVDLEPDRILYVVDKRQALHFIQVFRAAAKAGYVNESQLEHIGFGTMNGEDGKPFKTRAGGVMRLSDMVQMSRDAARVDARFSEDVDDETQDMIDAIGMAAIKYGDLSNPRTSDYVFKLDNFAKFEGNTGPYIQYAAVRARSLLNNVGVPSIPKMRQGFEFMTEYERNLALALLNYHGAIQEAFNKRMPSELCGYVYGLARTFNAFYKNCPVQVEDDPETKNVRLWLTEGTYSTIRKVLDVLAIPTPKKMGRAEPNGVVPII